MNSYDEWITADQIVKRILGDEARKNAAKVFIRDIASDPNFPKPSMYGKSRKVWCWGEVSDYFRAKREATSPIYVKPKTGKPRRKAA